MSIGDCVWLIKLCFFSVGLVLNSVENTPQRHKEVLQGQEISNTLAHEPGAQTSFLVPQLVPPSNPDLNHIQLRLENQLYFPMQNLLYHCPGNAIAFPGENVLTPSFTNQGPPLFATYNARDNVAYSGSMSVSKVNSSNSGSQESMAFKRKSEDETVLAQPNGCGRCMLFGVNLVNSHPELPSPQVATSSELNSTCSLPPTTRSSVSETIQVSETCKSVSGEKQCKKCCSVGNRSCTKVRYLLDFPFCFFKNRTSFCLLTIFSLYCYILSNYRLDNYMDNVPVSKKQFLNLSKRNNS